MTTRKMAKAKAGALKPGALPARNSTLDLARISVREINQLLHEEYLLPADEEPASHRLAQLSVPVFGPDRSVALVIGLTGFRHDLTAEEIDSYVAPLIGAASRVTERIHGARP